MHAYAPLLGFAQSNSERVALHAGFIPRSYARLVMRESLDAALAAAKAEGYVHADETCEASEAHYGFFESLLSGRSVHGAADGTPPTPPSDKYRKMFPAQVIKDCAMAHKVIKLMETPATAESGTREHDRYLVICGIGHSGCALLTPRMSFPSLSHAVHDLASPSQVLARRARAYLQGASRARGAELPRVELASIASHRHG